MRAKLLGIVLTPPIAISSFASTETLSFTPDNINADISLGTLSGKTKERVYLAEEGGRKVSQLDWKFNNAAIIKGAINWDLMPPDIYRGCWLDNSRQPRWQYGRSGLDGFQ